jgi:hypothetical protein
MYIGYNWELNKNTYNLNEFKKVIRNEIKKVLKPIRNYVKVNARDGNSKI